MESRVSNLVRGDSSFMQCRTACDACGNLVRVIGLVRGTDLLTHLDSLRVPHEEYRCTLIPAILARVADNVAATRSLHPGRRLTIRTMAPLGDSKIASMIESLAFRTNGPGF